MNHRHRNFIYSTLIATNGEEPGGTHHRSEFTVQYWGRHPSGISIDSRPRIVFSVGEARWYHDDTILTYEHRGCSLQYSNTPMEELLAEPAFPRSRSKSRVQTQTKGRQGPVVNSRHSRSFRPRARSSDDLQGWPDHVSEASRTCLKQATPSKFEW